MYNSKWALKRYVSRFSGYIQEGRTSRPDGWQGKYVT